MKTFVVNLINSENNTFPRYPPPFFGLPFSLSSDPTSHGLGEVSMLQRKAGENVLFPSGKGIRGPAQSSLAIALRRVHRRL